MGCVSTWDEDDSSASNHILTAALVRPLVIPGSQSDQVVNHYTIVRMICEALGFPTFERATAEPRSRTCGRRSRPRCGLGR